MASPLLQQLLPSDLEHDLEQPDLESLELAVVFAAELEQQDFPGASLLVLAAVVLVLSAEVTL